MELDPRLSAFVDRSLKMGIDAGLVYDRAFEAVRHPACATDDDLDSALDAVLAEISIDDLVPIAMFR